MKSRIIFLWCSFFFSALLWNNGWSQGARRSILNDTAKNVYGPKTTTWISERDIFYNRLNYKTLDTTISNFHRWTYVQRSNNFVHDLGNMGTALNPVFPLIASVAPGASSGFIVYNRYWETQELRYFNTKSPYTRFNIVWGGDGRATTEVEFTRNINPNWNFGFNYRPILVDKQIQRRRKGDRQVISHYYDFHTSFKSPNSRYILLANYRRLRHQVNENGGILFAANATFDSYFSQNAQPNLVAARTEDLKSTGHLYHQYQLAKPLQVYHSVDITKQKNGFSDDLSLEVNNFYGQKIISPGFDSVKVGDASFFRTFQQEIGIKGNAAFLFYNFYLKARSFDNYNRKLVGYDLPADFSGDETYVGARVSLRYDSLNELRGHAEYLLDGNYRVEGNLSSKWVDAELISMLAKPSFISQVYRGAHHFWMNNFDDVFTNQLKAYLKLKINRFELQPGITYLNLSNYIFFKKDTNLNSKSVIPIQSAGVQQLALPEFKMQVKFFRHFYLRPQIIMANIIQNDDGALQVPELFVNTQLAYENTVAKGNLQLQCGVEAHWRSEYNTMNYDPAIQQFYVQNSFVNPSYLLADVFLAGKLKRGRFFFKYHNIQQAFLKNGYLTTPGYRGISNIIDFGFDLFLFD